VVWKRPKTPLCNIKMAKLPPHLLVLHDTFGSRTRISVIMGSVMGLFQLFDWVLLMITIKQTPLANGEKSSLP
jgi:hypothetical protein